MLLGFTGAQCTGKTTLLNMCKDTFNNYKFVDEVTRKVGRMGHVINEQGDDVTQLFILKEHLTNHVIPPDENWVLDRCVVDGYVYTRWLYEQGRVSSWVLSYAGNLLSMLGDRLDHILYTCPDNIPIEADGGRSVDKQFRDDIINIYDSLINNSAYLPGKDTWRNKVVKLSGSPEQRMYQIVTLINEQ